VNLHTLPAHGAFFFEDPDLTSTEARMMLKGVSVADYGTDLYQSSPSCPVD
jgi:hypothetical protein